jgi:AbrB family looped-hinge helix DNA binding protein
MLCSLWNNINMARKARIPSSTRVRETAEPYGVTVAARGRIVLPAGVRRALSLEEGDRLQLTVERDGSLRLTSFAAIASSARGAYRERARGRSLAAELVAERRREAEREDR